MDVERARDLLLQMPHVEETVQWGGKLIFWAAHKAFGGKMFTIMDLESPTLVIAFAAGPERAAELCEVEGFRPAPYLARAHWVAAERWDVFSFRAWEEELQASHRLVSAKLSPRTKRLLTLPKKERARLIAEHAASLKLLASDKPSRQSSS